MAEAKVVKDVNAAAQVTSRLLEDGAGDPDAPQRYVDDYAEFGGFDTGANRVVKDARSLYRRLKKAGVLGLMVRDLSKGRLSQLDDDSVAQGLVKIALERSGSRGAQRVEKWLRRHAPEYI